MRMQAHHRHYTPSWTCHDPTRQTASSLNSHNTPTPNLPPRSATAAQQSSTQQKLTLANNTIQTQQLLALYMHNCKSLWVAEAAIART